MQASDKASAFNTTKLPADYNYDEAATTEPGKNKGLVVMLDAHSGSTETIKYFDYESLLNPFWCEFIPDETKHLRSAPSVLMHAH